MVRGKQARARPPAAPRGQKFADVSSGGATAARQARHAQRFRAAAPRALPAAPRERPRVSRALQAALADGCAAPRTGAARRAARW
eukprot:199409-Prymnesium_polylepis.1